MKRGLVLLAIAVVWISGDEAFARGGGRGGGRGFGGGRSFGGQNFGGSRNFGGQNFGGGFNSRGFDAGRAGGMGDRGFYGGHTPSFEGGGARSSFDRPSQMQRNNFGDAGAAGRSFDRAGVGQGREFGIGDRPGIGADGRLNDRGALDRAGNRADWNRNIDRWADRGDRPWNRPWNNPYDRWHGDWRRGYWNYWHGWYPWAAFGAGAAAAWWATPGETYVYSNPYYVVNDTADTYAPDYAQPIPPVPQNATAGSSAPGEAAAGSDDAATSAAIAIFDQGRALFKQGDYQGALGKVDEAIKQLPSDAALHEFRAACLFALGKYQEAAAGIYAVLSAGPGWDWETMKELYPDAATYTKQLRALEAFKKSHPDAAYASFLLAYEYLVLGYPDQAAGELQQVVKLKPDDKLSAALLKALQNRDQAPTGAPQPGANN